MGIYNNNIILCLLQGEPGLPGMKGEKGVPGVAGPRVSILCFVLESLEIFVITCLTLLFIMTRFPILLLCMKQTKNGQVFSTNYRHG